MGGMSFFFQSFGYPKNNESTKTTKLNLLQPPPSQPKTKTTKENSLDLKYIKHVKNVQNMTLCGIITPNCTCLPLPNRSAKYTPTNTHKTFLLETAIL